MRRALAPFEGSLRVAAAGLAIGPTIGALVLPGDLLVTALRLGTGATQAAGVRIGPSPRPPARLRAGEPGAPLALVPGGGPAASR